MKLRIVSITLGLMMAFTSMAIAQQPGTVDLTFNPYDEGFDTQVTGSVQASAVQSDGRVLIGGFTFFNGLTRHRISRLLSDGRYDPTFSKNAVTNGEILAINIDADGRIIIGGNFTIVHGANRSGIARLNADGSLDTSFNPGTGSSSAVRAIEIDSQGRIFIAGSFTMYNGVSRGRVARLLPTGAVDTSFNPGLGANAAVYALALDNTDRVLIGGDFVSFNGTERNRIARINSNGSLDETFNPGLGANGTVRAIKLDVLSRVYVGGAFTQFNGTNRFSIVRLGTSGLVDASFNFSVSSLTTIYAIQVTPENELVVGGDSSIPSERLVRLKQDGTRDFNFAQHFENTIITISLDSNDDYIVGGSFRNAITVGGVNSTRFRIARALKTNYADVYFNNQTGIDGTIYASKVDNSGRIYIGGSFQTVDGLPRRGIARLLPDGSLDTSFDPGSGVNGIGLCNSRGSRLVCGVSSILIGLDGKITIAGNFTSVDGIPLKYIARFNTDGSVDNSFSPGTGASAGIVDMVFDSQQRIIIAGEFTQFDGLVSNKLARLNADGSLDISFKFGQGPNAAIYALATDVADNIYVGGNFSTFSGVSRTGMVKISPDGTVDTSFRLSNGRLNTDGTCCRDLNITYISSINRNTDNNFVISGNFNYYTTRWNYSVTVIDDTGQMNTSSFTGSYNNVPIWNATFDPLNRILITGSFTQYQVIINNTYTNIPRKHIALLNSNGLLNMNFDPFTGPNGLIQASSYDAQGNIVIAGEFTNVNNVGRNRIARLFGSGQSEPSGLAMERQPIGGTIGLALATQPIVNIVDGSNNIIRSDNTTQVTASIFSGSDGVLTGTTTVMAVNGVATFTNLVMNGMAGINYRLQFDASPYLNPVVTDPFMLQTPNSVPSFSISNPQELNGTTGSQVSLHINLSDAGGLGVTSVNFRVTYDPHVLFLSSSLLDMQGSIMPDATVLSNDLVAGEMLISLANPSGVSITNSGRLITLQGYFLSEGNPNVELLPRLGSDLPLLPAPLNWPLFPANPYDGTVTGSPAIAISTPNVKAEINQAVNIPVHISNLDNKGIRVFDLRFLYDPDFVFFADDPSTVIRTNSIIGTTNKSQVIVNADNTTGELAIIILITDNEGHYYEGEGLLFTLVGMYTSNQGITNLEIDMSTSKLDDGMPFQYTSGEMRVNPPLQAYAPIQFASFPNLINTQQGTYAYLYLNQDESANWGSFGFESGGQVNWLGTVEDNSSNDLDPAVGAIRFKLPDGFMPTPGEVTLRAYQSNVDVETSDGMNAINSNLSLSTVVNVVTAPSVYGNIDGDGLLSPVDVSYLLQYIVRLRELTTTQMNWVDVNIDGFVNSLDASLILQKILTPSFCLKATGLCPSKEIESSGRMVWEIVTVDGRRYVELQLKDGLGITSIELELKGFSTLSRDWIQVPSDSWMLAHNLSDGVLRIATAGANEITQATLLRIPASEFVETSSYSFETLELNGISVTVPSLPGITTSTGDDTTLPTAFEVLPNYPNPFNPTTTLRFNLHESSNVSITVYDLAGRVMMKLPNSQFNAGRHSVSLDASNLGSGVYIYKVSAGNYEGVGKMTLIK